MSCGFLRSSVCWERDTRCKPTQVTSYLNLYGQQWLICSPQARPSVCWEMQAVRRRRPNTCGAAVSYTHTHTHSFHFHLQLPFVYQTLAHFSQAILMVVHFLRVNFLKWLQCDLFWLDPWSMTFSPYGTSKECSLNYRRSAHKLKLFVSSY